MKRRKLLALAMIAAIGAVPALPVLAADDKKTPEKKSSEDSTFDQDTVLRDAEAFFGKGAEGLAKVIEKAFKENGRPVGYIKGQEAAGAITVGLIYGDGTLVMKNAKSRRVFWSGPSIGFDLGANAAKVFVLVYGMSKPGDIFMRFPAVDGSFYYVGGAGINYQRRNGITLAPIRLGVGLRAGASVGYIHYTPKKTYNPF
jgi:hypothetical protein